MTGKPTHQELLDKVSSLEKEIHTYRKKEEILYEYERENDLLFQKSPFIMFVVDENRRICRLNETSVKLTKRLENESIGMLGGEALRCVHALDDTDHCGFKDICKTCVVRNTVLDTCRTGKPHSFIKASIPYSTQSGVTFLHVLLFTSLLKSSSGKRVMVCMEDITENLILEEKLTQSEERFQLAMDASKDGIWDWNIETGEVYYSPGYVNMLGYSTEEVPNRLDFWSRNIHPDDKPSTVSLYRGCIANQCDSFDVKFRMRTKEGDWRWISSRGKVVVRDEDGNGLRLVGTHTDITEWKLAEELNQKSKQEIESIFRSAPTGIGVVSNRVITQINDRVEEISGYSYEELVGQNSRILYPSDEEYNYVGQEKYRQIDIHGTGTVETQWQRKDGTIIDVLMSSTPIDMDDYAKGVTFTALDISETKRNEAALLESEEKYRSMMEAQNDPAYICSSDFRIEYMNPAMIEWIGNDATGEKCHEAIWGADQKCAWCEMKRVLASEKLVAEIKVPESEKTYHVASAPIHHADGSISKLTSYRDITEIKQLTIRLQQAQKMESLGTLAGGIAHDFNNILFPILGHSEMMLEDTPKDSLYRDGLNEIFSAALRAKELVQQILTFSRQEKNDVRLVKTQTIIKEALKLIRSTIPTTIEIKQDIDPACRAVKADPTQIHQIIMNLATNSYHAMEENGGILKVTLEEIEVEEANKTQMDLAPRTYACLTVADTGIGINKAVEDKIFDPFFTTKEKGKGTGMGLSVVHGIVKNMNGGIQVQSKPGEGTEIIVYLPIEKRSFERHSIVPEKDLIGGTEHILLVDDEKSIIDMEKMMLKQLGYTISSFADGTNALDAFVKDPEKFDIVITDLAMPKMAGDKLASEILNIRPDTPIILNTGYNEKITPDVIKKMGVKEILIKPITRNELAQALRKTLDAQKNMV